MSLSPVFILAPPRSFTSVVCGVIGQHPEMYALPEVNLFAGDDYDGLNAKLYKMRPGFRHGLLRAVAELGLGDQSEHTIEVAKAWLEEEHAVSSGDLYRDLVSWSGDRRLVDKSPIYVYSEENLQRISTAFPSARYIHLVRHPRATVESIYGLRKVVQEGLGKIKVNEKLRERIQTRYDRLAEMQNPDSLWLEPHRRVLDHLAEVPDERKLFLRGEDFMSDLDRHLQQITEWLGIDSGTDAIEAMKHPERSPFACLGPNNAKFGNDPSYMENPALRPYSPKLYSFDGELKGGGGAVLSEEIKACARSFGYTDQGQEAPAAHDQ